MTDAIAEMEVEIDIAADAPVPFARKATAVTAGALATIVVALSGYLAARANWETSVHERNDAVYSATAERAMHEVAETSAQLTEANIRTVDAYVRAGAAADVRTSDPTDRRLFDANAKYWTREYRRTDGAPHLPDAELLARRHAPAVAAEERAESEGELAARWLVRENADLGVAGLAAVALLLVSTSLAIPPERYAHRLVALGVCLSIFGATRLVVVNVRGVHQTPASAIEAYTEGAVAQEQDDLTTAVAAFSRAVAADPRYASAWESLGDVYVTEPDRRSAAYAVTAYRHALALGRRSASLLNNIAYAELLSGSLPAAADHSAAARTEKPHDVRIAATAAEVLVAAGDRRGAMGAARDLVASVAGEPASFRNGLFSGWRRDLRDMRAAGVGGALRDEFFGRLNVAAVCLDTYGSPYPPAAGPKVPMHGTASYDTDSLQLHWVATAPFRPGDRVSVRVYRDETDLVASTWRLVGRPSSRLTGTLALDAGTYRVEIYRNGVLRWSRYEVVGP